MAPSWLRIGFCEGDGGAAVGDEVVRRVTWPRTELRGQVTRRPPRAGSPGRGGWLCGPSVIHRPARPRAVGGGLATRSMASRRPVSAP